MSEIKKFQDYPKADTMSDSDTFLGVVGDETKQVEKKVFLSEINTALSQQDKETLALNILGYVPPKEVLDWYITQNGREVTVNGGRVDLGSLEFNRVRENQNTPYCFTSNPIDNLKGSTDWAESIANAFCHSYKIISWRPHRNYGDAIFDKSIALSPTSNISIRDDNIGDVQSFKNATKGVYLYYELATPITRTIDGNEAVSELKSSLNDYGLTNVVGGIRQGLYDDSNGSYMTNDQTVCSTEPITCNDGDRITLKVGKVLYRLCIDFYDSNNNIISHPSISNSDELVVTAPPNAKKFNWWIWDNTSSASITPSTAPRISVYVNNSIDGLKADLQPLGSNFIQGMSGTIYIPIEIESVYQFVGAHEGAFALAYITTYNNNFHVEHIRENSYSHLSQENGNLKIVLDYGHAWSLRKLN